MWAVVEIWFESLIPFLLKDSHIVQCWTLRLRIWTYSLLFCQRIPWRIWPILKRHSAAQVGTFLPGRMHLCSGSWKEMLKDCTTKKTLVIGKAQLRSFPKDFFQGLLAWSIVRNWEVVPLRWEHLKSGKTWPQRLNSWWKATDQNYGCQWPKELLMMEN